MASDEPLKVLLCGDVMLGRGVDQIMPHPVNPRLHEAHLRSALDYVRLAEAASGPIPRPSALDYVWGDALETWDALSPDVRIVNLETAVTRSEAYIPKGINYRMSPDHVGCLTAAKIDACALANNHALDWNERGLLDTLAALRRAGVRAAGAGENLAAAQAPAVLEAGAKGRVLVVACATGDSGVPDSWAAAPGKPGVNRVALSDAAVDQIAGSLERVRRPGDVAVVSIHWGPNWSYAIPDQRRRFAHALIERAKVSIVHGHSSHHPQAAEVHDGRLILYGCGDLINDYEGIHGMEDFRPGLTAAYVASIDARTGDLAGLDITPFRIARLRLTTPTPTEADWLRERLGSEFARLGLAVEPASPSRFRARWGGARGSGDGS